MKLARGESVWIRLCVHGKACIKGTRIAVSVILDNPAAGEPARSHPKGLSNTQSRRTFRRPFGMLLWQA